MGLTLGIETSCDETSAGLLDAEGRVVSLVVHSQDVHQVYGGVVPELAARAHLTQIDAVVDRALLDAGATPEDIDLVAATAGPGLIGALLVGLGWAKAFAARRRLPFVGVHHMEAHLFGPLLDHPELRPPFVSLLVSGGHTMLLHVHDWGDYELLGQTRDDAAGEAFDKVAKAMDLPYPGGPEIAARAEGGDPTVRRLPRPLLKGAWDPTRDDAFDFSFSGLKTAAALWIASCGPLGGWTRGVRTLRRPSRRRSSIRWSPRPWERQSTSVWTRSRSGVEWPSTGDCERSSLGRRRNACRAASCGLHPDIASTTEP